VSSRSRHSQNFSKCQRWLYEIRELTLSADGPGELLVCGIMATMRHHAVISGTGRAGTSLLVKLLSAVGLDTGHDRTAMHWYAHARAGLELDVRDAEAPYVVKSPWFCDYAGEVLSDPNIAIDHVFVPIRDLAAAAASRQHVVDTAPVEYAEVPPSGVPGGLWYTDDEAEQERVLLDQLYKLLLAVSGYGVPVTLIRYPLLTRDPEYLYAKLQPVLEGIEYQEFATAFSSVVQPELVHQFSESDS